LLICTLEIALYYYVSVNILIFERSSVLFNVSYTENERSISNRMSLFSFLRFLIFFYCFKCVLTIAITSDKTTVLFLVSIKEAIKIIYTINSISICIERIKIRCFTLAQLGGAMVDLAHPDYDLTPSKIFLVYFNICWILLFCHLKIKK